MADLFSSSGMPPPSRRAAPPPPRTIAATAYPPAMIAGGGGLKFHHPCGICGAAVAPFGSGVRLRAALARGDDGLLGEWRCGACR